MEYYTVEEICKMLKTSRPTLYRWRKRGIITAHKVGRRLLFERSDIERAVKREGENEEVKK